MEDKNVENVVAEIGESLLHILENVKEGDFEYFEVLSKIKQAIGSN
ncbi:MULTISPECIES: hypothetical protein [Bacillus]|nr:hypothetical protein [Bacillus cereus]MCQ6303687.1 hypothetical protein [Bacillus cereus]